MPVLFSSACATYQYDAKPVETKQITAEYIKRNLENTELGNFLSEYGYVRNDWPMKIWDLRALALAGYFYNPDIQVAIAEYNKSITNADVAALYPNPGIQIPLEYHDETGGGISPWLIGIIFDFVFERGAKRQARVDIAEAEKDTARLSILQKAWQIYTDIRDAYLDHFVALSTYEFLEKKEEIIVSLLDLLERSFELGETSAFEVNSTRLELQKVKLELASEQIRISDSRHILAGKIGIPASALEKIQFSFDEIVRYLEFSSYDRGDVQELALTHRLDIQQALLEYAVYESALRLEIENQYPDINLSPGFIFDQSDNVWTLGTSWIIPLLHTNNESAIRLALEDRKIKQAEIFSLQTGILNEIELSRSRLESTKLALGQAILLMEEASDRNLKLQKQFELGYLDNLPLIRNRLELLSIEGALGDFELNVIKAAFGYENTVQYPLTDIPGYLLYDDIQDKN